MLVPGCRPSARCRWNNQQVPLTPPGSSPLRLRPAEHGRYRRARPCATPLCAVHCSLTSKIGGKRPGSPMGQRCQLIAGIALTLLGACTTQPPLDSCAGVECGSGQVCAAGQCVKDPKTTAPIPLPQRTYTATAAHRMRRDFDRLLRRTGPSAGGLDPVPPHQPLAANHADVAHGQSSAESQPETGKSAPPLTRFPAGRSPRH